MQIKSIIGAIDLSAGNNANGSIELYLPGEVALGVSREALISAYGVPDTLTSGFSCDTYIWNGKTSNESFLAEVSPGSNNVIRICLKKLPVIDNKQESIA